MHYWMIYDKTKREHIYCSTNRLHIVAVLLYCEHRRNPTLDLDFRFELEDAYYIPVSQLLPHMGSIWPFSRN